eukprot:s1604_g4.t1
MDLPADVSALLRLDKFALNAALRLCARTERWRCAYVVLELMRGELIEVDIIAVTTVLAACSRSSQWQRALVLISAASALQPDTTTWNAVIHGQSKGLDWRRAFLETSALRGRSLQTSKVTCTESLTACCGCRKWMQALGILQLQHPSLRADVIMYSSVLSAATSEWKNGLQGVAAMTWRCLQVDVVACNSLLNAMRGGCGGGAGWQAISNRLVAFQRLGLKFTTVTVNVVTNGLAESGQWRWAMHALGTVRQASLQDNLAIYGSAVHACAASWVRASQLLQTLRQSPIEANTIVLGAATTACGKDQRWTQSTHLLSELRSNALRVSTVAQNAVLSCCGQAQLWRLALAFWSTALGHGLELDDVSSGAVIKASGYWGVAVQHLNLTEIITLNTALDSMEGAMRWTGALSLLRRFVPVMLQTDAASDNTIISALGKAGAWSLAASAASGFSQCRCADVVSLGATVSAYERAFYWQRGLLLLTLFARRSLPLNTVVCSAAIGSCEKAQLQMAMEQNRRGCIRSRDHLLTSALVPKRDLEGLASPRGHRLPEPWVAFGGMGREVLDWLPLLSGTLHPRAGGLPTIPAGITTAASPGWRLMGIAPGKKLEVYAALSTTPSRLRSGRELKSCLMSLLKQQAPMQVLLAVPRGPWRRGGGSAAYPSALPPWLVLLKRRWRRLKVVRCEDFGPGTGLLAAAKLVRDPSAWILAVDDDHNYHPELITNLLRFAAGTPGAAVGAHGWLQLRDFDFQKASEISGPALARNLRRGDVNAGPILCHFLGLLLQRQMLQGLQPLQPPRRSACGDHNDIWLSAHLAKRRIRRAMVSDPLGASDLSTHRRQGLSLSRRRRRRPEHSCLAEFLETHGTELWKPFPRVVLCSLQSPLGLADHIVGAAGMPTQAVYSCGRRPRRRDRDGRDGIRWLPCSASSEEEFLSHVLLREREASTILMLPPSLPGNSAQSHKEEAAVMTALLNCLANLPVSEGFCEAQRWRAVTVAALACFNSADDEGLLRIYGCTPQNSWELNRSGWQRSEKRQKGFAGLPWPAREICRLLVERKAEVSTLNRKGQSALHLAGRAGFQEVLSWLSARAGKQIVELRDHHGNTARMYGQQALAAAALVPHGPKSHILRRSQS